MFDDQMMQAGPDAAPMQPMAPPEPPLQLPDIERPPAPEEPEKLGADAIDQRARKACEDGRLATFLMGRFNYCAGWKERYVMPLVYACMQAYEAYKPPYSQFQHTYILRETFRQMETLKPLVQAALLGGDLFHFKAPKPELDPQYARATVKCRRQIQARENDTNLRYALDNASMHGVSYIWQHWDEYEILHNRISASYEEGTEKTNWERKTEAVRQAGPTLECCEIADVYTDPFTPEIHNSPYAFVRRTITASGLKDWLRNGKIDPAVLKDMLTDMKSGSAGTVWQDRQEWRVDIFESDVEDMLNDGEGSYSILFAWTNDGWEYIIGEGKYMLQARKSKRGNPLRNFRNYPQSWLHYGPPEPALTLEEHKLLADFVSMTADAVHLRGCPPIQGSTTALQQLEGFTFAPGARLPNDDGALTTFEFPSVQGDTMSFIGFLLNNARNATGVTEGLSGTGEQSDKATTQQNLTQASNMRVVGSKSMWWSKTLKRIYSDTYHLNADHLDESETIPIDSERGAGRIFVPVTPADFDGPDTVEVVLASQADSTETQQQRALQKFQLFNGDPLTNQFALRVSVWQAFGDDPKEMINSPAYAVTTAMDQIATLKQYGFMTDALPTEDHRQHLQVKEQFMGTPEFMQFAPDVQQALIRNIEQHVAMFQQEQAALQNQQAMGSTPVQEPSGSPVNQTDGQTEGQMANGMTGAAQAGAMQGGVM